MAWHAERSIKMVVVAAVAVVFALLVHRCHRRSRGIQVCLRNVDTQPLRSGELAVRSSRSTRSHPVGELAPAKTACVWVKADDEASLDVTFTTLSGVSKVILLNGYIEPGTSGSISADVAADGARAIKHDIDVD